MAERYRNAMILAPPPSSPIDHVAVQAPVLPNMKATVKYRSSREFHKIVTTCIALVPETSGPFRKNLKISQNIGWHEQLERALLTKHTTTHIERCGVSVKKRSPYKNRERTLPSSTWYPRKRRIPQQEHRGQGWCRTRR